MATVGFRAFLVMTNEVEMVEIGSQIKKGDFGRKYSSPREKGRKWFRAIFAPFLYYYYDLVG